MILKANCSQLLFTGNNNKFSSCSKASIKKVLDAKATCFKKPGEPICGNRVVEKGGCYRLAQS